MSDTESQAEEVAPVVLSKRKLRKNAYWAKLEAAIQEYKNILIVTVDFVGSKQMQEVRMAIRGRGVILMGKNTIIRKVLSDNVKANPKLENLIPHIRGNMGFIFTNGDLNELRKEVQGFKMPAAAKSGVIAPISVTIPAGPTSLDPGQTSFFQTLNIATKISKGAIEITSAVNLVTAGTKVSSSAVALLNKLGIRPFEYGVVVKTIYEDGSVYDAAVLDLSEEDLIGKFCYSAGLLAAVSFEIGDINQATVPHSFGRAFKTLVAMAINTGYMFEEMKIVKEMLENPGAFAAAGGDAAGGDAAAAPEPEEEEEEESAGIDMFGGDAEEEGGDY